MFAPRLFVTSANHKDVVLAVIYPACHCCEENTSIAPHKVFGLKIKCKILGQLHSQKFEPAFPYAFFEKKKKKCASCMS